MPVESTFLMEDFLEAIASQLDRAQDTLAFKAINRPLTYAIRDFTLALQVFVDMDDDGNVRLRPSAPNESGASTMNIGFTTVTAPMIKENTMSLAQNRAPSLQEAGFAPAERRSLERLGVRNTAQLRRLASSTGTSTVARLTSTPVDRLRAALQLDRPQVTSVEPAPAAPTNGAAPGRRVIRMTPDTQHIHLFGSGLAGDDGLSEVRLNGEPVTLAEADEDRLVVPVPSDVSTATLEITLPDGQLEQYELQRSEHHDPWINE